MSMKNRISCINLLNLKLESPKLREYYLKLCGLVNDGDYNAVELFLKKGLDVNKIHNYIVDVKVPYKEMTVMHMAALKSHFHLFPLFIEYGAKIDSLDQIVFSTPLHMAILSQHFNKFYTIVYLLENGANPNAITSEGKTILMYAAANLLNFDHYCVEKFAIIKLLLSYGAESDLVDYAEKKAIDYIENEADRKEYQKILKEHKKRLENKLLEGASISRDPIGIITDYLVNL